MLIKAPTLFEAWKLLNLRFLVEQTKTGMLIPTRDFSRVIWPARLEVNHGFGFDDTDSLPPFFANYNRRVQLLRTRYVDPELWNEGLERLRARRHRMGTRNPLSFTFQFHRRSTKERKVPAGGGCLQTIVFVWYNGKWGLSVHLRASEITARLLADLVFVKETVSTIVKETELKRWSDDLKIKWNIDLASQMKYLIPIFLLYNYGEESVRDFLFRDKLPEIEYEENLWIQTIQDHFWKEFIHPEKIKWMQRKRWSEKFLNSTELDWTSESKKSRGE